MTTIRQNVQWCILVLKFGLAEVMTWAYMAHGYFFIQAGIQDRYLQNSYRHNLAFLIKFVIEGEKNITKTALLGLPNLLCLPKVTS